MPDEHTEPCPGDCGAREWVWVDQPKDEFKITVNDRRFLRSIKITPE